MFKSLSVLLFLSLASVIQAQTSSDSIYWDDRFTPNRGAMIEPLVSNGHSLYIAGSQSIGKTNFHEVGKWNGKTWEDMPFDNRDLPGWLALDSAGNLYDASQYLMKFDGRQWSMVDTTELPLIGIVTIATQDSNVYLGGDRLLWFDGHRMRDLTDSLISDDHYSPNVQSIAVKGDTVFIAGYFHCVLGDGDTVSHLVKWDGKQFSKVPLIHSAYNKLTVIDTLLYVVGEIDTAAGRHWSRSAIWNGRQWSVPAPNFAESGETFARFRDTLCTLNQRGLCFWNGSTWVVRDSTVHGNYLVEYDGKLAIANRLEPRPSDTSAIPGLVLWDGTTLVNTWQSPILGVDGWNIDALATYDDELVAVGIFDAAGTTYTHCIAAWDGDTWHPLTRGNTAYLKTLPDSLDYRIDDYRCLFSDGNDLYVGGRFRQVDGIPANSIARWDGAQWHPVDDGIRGNGPDPYVLAIHRLDNGDRVVGGSDFYLVGGKRSGCLAVWDGLTWHPADTALRGSVNTITSSGDTIYAGGVFVTDTVHHIMWIVGDIAQPIGEDLNGNVRTMIRDGDKIYAGGEFTASGSTPINHVAVWDGVHWQQIGEGIPDPVVMLKKIGGRLFASGHANWHDYLYEWTGTNWKTVAPRANNAILDVVSFQNALCVAGEFTKFGDTTSSCHFGILHVPSTYLSSSNSSNSRASITVYPNPASSVINFAGINPGAEYRIISDLGREVQHGKLESQSLSIRTLANGIYYVVLESPLGETTASFLVQR